MREISPALVALRCEKISGGDFWGSRHNICLRGSS
jgi:hypothetical protein